MKKTILTLALLAISMVGYAQNPPPIDFEEGGKGADLTWNVFENDDNPALEVIDNPFKSGSNESDKVARFTARATGRPWAGTEGIVGPFAFNSETRTIKIMVYKTVISDVGLKLETNSRWAEPPVFVANTKVNEWEELTFTFTGRNSAPEDEPFTGVSVFPDHNMAGRGQEVVVLFDNITFVEGFTITEGGTTPTNAPTTAAPAPTRAAENVISLYAQGYDNVPVDTWRTDWSSAGYSEVDIAGRPTKRYAGLDFAGIETVSNQLDISEMTHFHMNVWSSDFTQFSVKLVDFGSDGAFDGGDDTEHQVNIPDLPQGQWVPLDIPLANFVDMTGRNNLAQIIIVGQPTGATTVFVDNVYFYNDVEGSGPSLPTAAAPAPTRPASGVISLYAQGYDDVTVDTWRTDWSAAAYTEVELGNRMTKVYANLDFAGIETVSNQVNISSMTHLHINVWSADFTGFGIKLVDFGADGAFDGGDDTEYQVNLTELAQGEWISVNIPLADFVGMTGRNNLAQIILVGLPTAQNTVFVDNLYFYNETATSTEDDFAGAVKGFELQQNFPNPFNPSTNINYSIPAGGNVTLDVFNIQGQKVATLVNGFQSAGNYTVTFDASRLASGMYIYRLSSGNNVKVNKMMLIK